MADETDDTPKPSEVAPPADAVPIMPVHPGRWIYRTLFGSGAGTIALAAGQSLLHFDPWMTLILGLGGATHLLISRHGLRLGPGLQLVRAAQNQVAIGRPEVAIALLERAEKLYAVGAVRREAHLVRAQIALDRGDPEAALKEAERSLAIGASAITRAVTKQATWLPRISALSIRSFCRAVLGDATGARSDVAALDTLLKERPDAFLSGSPSLLSLEGVRTLREPIARAKLAEAIVLAQEGDRAALRDLMIRHRALFAEGSGQRERALVRGFERMLASPVSTAYRRPSETRAASDQALDAEDWIERVLPEVAPFVRSESAVAADASVTAPAAFGRSKEAAPAIDWGPAKRVAAVVGVWVGLLGMLAGVWVATGQFDRPENPSAWLVAATVALPMFFVVALVALSWMRVRSMASRRKVLADRLVDLAVAPATESRAALERIADSHDPITGGQARLALAELDLRAGDFEGAVSHAAKGLAPLDRRLMRATASDVLIPSLRAQRALAHAALGQSEDALREVEALGDDYASRGRTLYSVKLVVLAREGSLEEAARLAEARPAGVALDRPIEALSDLVRATHSESGLGLAETQRLQSELAEPSLRKWLTAAAPLALAAFDGHGASEVVPERVRVAVHHAPEERRDDAGRDERRVDGEGIDSLAVDEEEQALAEAETDRSPTALRRHS